MMNFGHLYFLFVWIWLSQRHSDCNWLSSSHSWYEGSVSSPCEPSGGWFINGSPSNSLFKNRIWMTDFSVISSHTNSVSNVIVRAWHLYLLSLKDDSLSVSNRSGGPAAIVLFNTNLLAKVPCVRGRERCCWMSGVVGFDFQWLLNSAVYAKKR